MRLDERNKLILRWFSRCHEVTEDLKQQIPKSTLYDRIRVLLNSGLLRRVGKTSYEVTPAGQKALLGRQEGLARFYPLLAELPTAQHLAMAELVISAISARGTGFFLEHLPSFLLVGPTLCWKTSLGRFICHMLGTEPSRFVIDLATETSRSLWLRRDARGRVPFRRHILDAPFVVFDEFGYAPREVKKSVMHFVQGRLQIPFENETLTFRVTPLLTMNPIGEGNDICSKTGLNPPQIRRLVVCDLGEVEIEGLAEKGEELVERAAQATPLKLRHAKSTFTHLRRPISSLMRQLLLPEALQLVDFEMLRVLVAGMAAYLPVAQALQRVLQNYCTVVETLGWTVENWRVRLAEFAEVENEQPRSEIIVLEGQEMGGDIQKHLVYLQVETGKDAAGALEVLVELWQAMRRCGLGLDDLKHLADVLSHAAAQRLSPERLERYLGFERAVAACDIAPEQVTQLATLLKQNGYLDGQRLEVLMRVVELLERYDLNISDLRQAVSVLTALRRQGVPPSIVHALKDAAVQFYKSGVDVEEALEDLVQAVIDEKTLNEEIEALMQKRDEIWGQLEKLERELQRKREELLEMDKVAARLAEELAEAIPIYRRMAKHLAALQYQWLHPYAPLPPQG